MVLNNIKSRNKERGFTIVELLIVIVVIGILAGITIVAYSGITNRANQSKIQGNANAVQSVAEAFNADKGYYPALAVSGTDALALGSASTQVPAGVTIVKDLSTSPILAYTGNTVAYACFAGVTASCTSATGGRLTYWDPVSNAKAYLYVGAATSAGPFAYPAT